MNNRRAGFFRGTVSASDFFADNQTGTISLGHYAFQERCSNVHPILCLLEILRDREPINVRVKLVYPW